jgi:hypothetical protein
MEWKIRQSALWPADHEEWTADCAEFSEPDVSQDAGDAELHLVEADGVKVSADIVREYGRAGAFEGNRVLEEFEIWAMTRKGHCATCGDLPVEVDTLDGGVEQSTITIRCPHGVLVVQYHVVNTARHKQVTQDLIDRIQKRLDEIGELWEGDRDLPLLPDAAKLAPRLIAQSPVTYFEIAIRTLTVALRRLTEGEQEEWFASFRAINCLEPMERPKWRMIRVSVTEYGEVSAGLASVVEMPDVALEDL